MHAAEAAQDGTSERQRRAELRAGVSAGSAAGPPKTARTSVKVPRCENGAVSRQACAPKNWNKQSQQTRGASAWPRGRACRAQGAHSLCALGTWPCWQRRAALSASDAANGGGSCDDSLQGRSRCAAPPGAAAAAAGTGGGVGAGRRRRDGAGKSVHNIPGIHCRAGGADQGWAAGCLSIQKNKQRRPRPRVPPRQLERVAEQCTSAARETCG